MSGRPWIVLAIVPALLLAVPARAVDQKDIDRAVERGVAALIAMQQKNGSWSYPQSGATSLAALALLECDVKPDSKPILAAAEFVRQDCMAATKTYSIALAIAFLDRLGDPGDVALIESLMVRLLAGQYPDGGWGYNCPSLAPGEVARLRLHLKKTSELRAGTGIPQLGKRTYADLPKEIQQQLTIVSKGTGQIFSGAPTSGADNSNTQFATLAIWIGRRHGVPVDAALGRLDSRYRTSQNGDGTWGYIRTLGRPMGMAGVAATTGTATMTCAGGLGIAVAHGAAHDPDARRKAPPLDPLKDKALQSALLALGNTVGEPLGKLVQAKKDGPIPLVGEGNGRAYYFLWSLERLCMALNLDTIGKKDWFTWGAEIILANQQVDGSWRGDYHGAIGTTAYGADTAFALLFLRRANLMKDLSSNLKGKLKDPATVELKLGGVGGAGLGKSIKRPLEGESGKPEDPRPKIPDKLKPLPERVESTDAELLSGKLVKASGAERGKLLDELRDSKGGKYTEALALSIPLLDGEMREKARDALAERMAKRLSDKQLGEDLKDNDAEIRRAAVQANYMKDIRKHIPLIIDRLGDMDPGVVRAAHVVLKEMTKQDFGPEPGAKADELEKALAKWKEWWEKEK